MWRWKTEHGVVDTLHLCHRTEDRPGQNIVVDQCQRQLFVLVQAVEVHLVPEQQTVLRQTGLSQQKGAVRAQEELSPWDVEHRDRHPLTIKTLRDDNINDEQNNNPELSRPLSLAQVFKQNAAKAVY